MTKKVVTNDGKKGGWLVGKRHYDKGGKPLGGIKAVVTDAGGKPVELEGGEVIINREASRKHWKELSRINQSAGNGVPIEPPSSSFDEDPSEDYENGGKIEFNANHIPNKWILNYAIKIKEEHPDVWALGGNIFGNQAFINLKRVAERGHWLDSEEWMYKKWRSFVARHKGDFRIQGVIAMLKWVDKVDKGWQYMKNLIEEEIKKREAKKSRKMSTGGGVRGMSWFNDFKKQQLKKGTQHELEHSDTIEKFKKKGVSDRQVAEQIAKDHLEEDENYYIELDKMERKKFDNGGDVTKYDVDTEGVWGGRGKPRIKVVSISAKTVKYLDYSDNKVKSDTREKFDRLFTPDTLSASPTNVVTPTQTPSKVTTTQWTANDLKNTKIIVDTPEKSKKFQELLFSLGGEWTDLDVPKKSLRKKVHFTDEQYLLVGSDLVFFYFSKKDTWDDSSKKEIFYDDIFSSTSTQKNSPATQSTKRAVSTPLNDYRIKTEKEFEAEFGTDWRREVGWTSSSNMDWLFGKRLNEITKQGNEKEYFTSVLAKTSFLIDKNKDPKGYEWSIGSKMWIYDPVLSEQTTSKATSELQEFIEKGKSNKTTQAIQKSEEDVKTEKELLFDQYNDILFLISITPTTDVDNMLALKQQAAELKTKLDLIDLELRKKAQSELTLLDELFNASSIQPQERYTITPYNDGFAPNGQSTELPKSIYDWTMTEEFQNWFGNFTLAYNYKNSSYENVPCSVVVNKNYEPQIVYHGTGAKFSFFKFDKFPAMYFAENEQYSNWFAELKSQQNGTNGYVYPFVLNIRTPLDLTLFNINPISPTEFTDWVYLQTGLTVDELKINKALLNPNDKNQAWWYLRSSPEMLQVLRDKNVCDGIVYYEDNPSVDKSSSAYQTKAYIVFNSNAAKIADPQRHISTIPAMRSFYLKRGGKL